MEKAYRFPPDQFGNPEVWMALPSRYSQVVRSPLANDDKNRIYWTNPGDPCPWFNTRERIAAGEPPYNLGIVQPSQDTAPAINSVEGGTAPPGADAIDRSYLYTYVNEFGEESAPSRASDTMSGPPDATWTVSGFPTEAPPNPPVLTYPAITGYRIYRTITSATTGAQFYFVEEVPLPQSNPGLLSTISRTSSSSTTKSWRAPTGKSVAGARRAGGDAGRVSLPGFTDNTIHFSEPDRPHTWPSLYDQSAHYRIVELAVWQQYLMVLTQGFPSAGSGNMPSNIVITQTQVAAPCIARGSTVIDLSGVFYSTQNGLVQFTGYACPRRHRDDHLEARMDEQVQGRQADRGAAPLAVHGDQRE